MEGTSVKPLIRHTLISFLKVQKMFNLTTGQLILMIEDYRNFLIEKKYITGTEFFHLLDEASDEIEAGN